MWFDLWQAAPIRGRRNWCKLPAPGGLEMDPRLNHVAYVFVFLCSIRCNSVVICCADGTCGQRRSAPRRSLLCFLTFFLAGMPWVGGPEKVFSPGPNPLSAAVLAGTSISSPKHSGFGAHAASLSIRTSLLGGKLAVKPTVDFYLMSITQENTFFVSSSLCVY